GGGEGEEAALVGADDEAGDVRADEADEADWAANGDGGGGDEGGGDQGDPAETVNADAHGFGFAVVEDGDVELAAEIEEDEPADGNQGKCDDALFVEDGLDGADEKCHGAANGGGLFHQCVYEEEEGAVDGVDDDADQEQGHGLEAAATAGEAEDDADRGEGAEEGGGFLAQGGEDSQSFHDGGEEGQLPEISHEGSAAADAEEVGIGEGISEDGLIGDACGGEGGADEGGVEYGFFAKGADIFGGPADAVGADGNGQGHRGRDAGAAG